MLDEVSPGRSARRRAVGALGRLLLATAAAAVLAAAAFGWALTRLVAENVTVLPAAVPADAPQRPQAAGGARPPVSVLVIGSDRREGADVGGGVTGQRADALMLVRLAGDRGHADVLALPRDSWVDIPGHGRGKLNASLAHGGVPLVVRTVEDLVGVRVDHVLVADFGAVRAITGDLGGVPVTNPAASTDPLTGTSFAAGPLLLDGDRAMTWVRQRYGLPHGDLDRIVRQQQLLAGIAKRLGGTGALELPGTLRAVVSTASRHVSVDAGLTVPRMTELAAALAAVPRDQVRFFTAPVRGTGTSSDGQAYLVLDHDLLAAAGRAIATDQAVPLPSNEVP
ncbi:LCP family protein [Actinokineospora guangxiensis]|uniref:LCP family protein n=1 Tax=Actinokineospora guangxiensis TaxID=1490288 RepID=A0ABW0EGS6_9PSEU